MTQDEIIEMARQAGGIDLSTVHGGGVRVWLGTDRTEFFETLIKLARTWVGLTDEDWKEIEDMPDTFDQGVAWAQAKLKQKNG